MSLVLMKSKYIIFDRKYQKCSKSGTDRPKIVKNTTGWSVGPRSFIKAIQRTFISGAFRPKIKFSEAEPGGACTAPRCRAAEYFVPQGKNIVAHPLSCGFGDELKRNNPN
jgi:hypothetical protein